MMNDEGNKVVLSMYDGDHLAEDPSEDDYAYLEDGTADLTTGLTSLEFIKATLRRTTRLWGTIAVAGLLIGLCLFLAIPAPYKATTSLLLTPETISGEPAGSPIANEVAIAESSTVAELAMEQLGLQQSVSSFLKAYTVTAVTDRIIDITVTAPTPGAAVTQANALATQFLRFRADVATAALTLTSASLSQQIAQLKANSVNKEISRLQAQTVSPTQQAKLRKLRAEPAALALTALQEATSSTVAAAQVKTEEVVHGSQVLNAASLNSTSQLRRFAEYVGIGLLAGLVLGIGIALVRELLSDRLRRRDDIARTLGAPVKLSVARVPWSRWRLSQRGLPVSRWRLGQRGLPVDQSTSVQRVVAYLASAIPRSPRDPASLAVVPVDDARVAAICLASLALQYAQEGLQVVVADLGDGAPAARLLGAAGPGVRTVRVQRTRLTVAVPKNDPALAAGPLQRMPGPAPDAGSLVTACGSADLLLILAPLDPSLGAEHLAGWTHSAVAMVTGGRSSAARIHAVAEMIRLAGITLISGVLVGADKTDQSLGTAAAPEAGRDGMADEDLPGLMRR